MENQKIEEAENYILEMKSKSMEKYLKYPDDSKKIKIKKFPEL